MIHIVKLISFRGCKLNNLSPIKPYFFGNMDADCLET